MTLVLLRLCTIDHALHLTHGAGALQLLESLQVLHTFHVDLVLSLDAHQLSLTNLIVFLAGELRLHLGILFLDFFQFGELVLLTSLFVISGLFSFFANLQLRFRLA